MFWGLGHGDIILRVTVQPPTLTKPKIWLKCQSVLTFPDITRGNFLSVFLCMLLIMYFILSVYPTALFAPWKQELCIVFLVGIPSTLHMVDIQ